MIMRQLIELLVNPFFLSFVLLGFCTWFSWRRTCETFIRGGLLTVFLILFFMSTGWLPQLLSNFLKTEYPLVIQINPNIQWVVVLSGGQSVVEGRPGNAQLNPASIMRLVEGVRLFRALPHAQLLLSGGGDLDQPSEAEHLAELTKWFGIPSQKIVLDTLSMNTMAQAQAIKNRIKSQPFYLVTSAIHMPRAMYLCEQLGLHPIAAPTDIVDPDREGSMARTMIPNTFNMDYFTFVLHELLGRIWATISSALGKY